MKILIACEFSGIVREAFRKKRHYVWSCDLLPTEIESNFHWQGDVEELLCWKWDMMIAFPPCTYLTNTQNRWLKDQSPRKSGALVGEERRKAKSKAAEFL